LTTKFVKKYGGTILKVACLVLAKVCKPACEAAVTAFKAVGVMINNTFHIPVGCLADALRSGCNQLCEVVCKKRRILIRRMVLPKNERENKRGQLETWKQKLHDDEKKRYNQKNEFDNAQKVDLNRRRLFIKHRNEGKEDIPTEKKRFDNFTAAANPIEAKNEFDNAQKEDLNRRRMFVKRVRNEGKQDLPSEKQKFDSINAAANPTQARNEFNNGQKEDLK